MVISSLLSTISFQFVIEVVDVWFPMLCYDCYVGLDICEAHMLKAIIIFDYLST